MSATGAGSGAVRVLLFGSLRDRLGTAELTVPAGAATVAELWEVVTTERPEVRRIRPGLRCARNLTYCDWDAPVQPGDEIAFMPPVCGGSAGAGEEIDARLLDEPIDVGSALASVGGGGDGALACFVGRVRDHSEGQPVHRLEYQAYEAMAAAEMQRIAAAASARHALSSVTVLHRTGSLAVGDIAVLVATAAPHRGPALDGCREVIEAVKHEVPIWKREHTAAGHGWVDARLEEAGGPTLTHVRADGSVTMVDVGEKAATDRSATAAARVTFAEPATLDLVRRGAGAKGDAVATARIAGIMAAKRTAELIPLCHPLQLDHVAVEITLVDEPPSLELRATVRCRGATGVEMEALTAVSVAALTLIDMLKAADRWMSIDEVRLLHKSGGRHGTLQRPPVGR